MIDKRLIKFLGKDIKYVFVSVAAMIMGFISNVCFTACICRVIQLVIEQKNVELFYAPFCVMIILAVVRFITTVLSGNNKDKIGRNVKRVFRQKIYDKITSLGMRM